MKLTNMVLVPIAAALLALGSPGCAEEATAADDNTSTGAEALATATPEQLAAAGWEKLGEQVVDGHFDTDTVAVGADDGRFGAIRIRVDDSSLLMFDIKVVFGNGETFEPNVRFVFDENTRSRVIDLPGNTRFIRKVVFKYGNLPGGGRARVSLFGKNATPPPAWLDLGERRVDGHFDHDTILVGGDAGAFSAIQIRVLDSSLVMENVRVTFGDGEVFNPQVRLVFDENSRSRVIDLPGAARHIKRVDFAYGNLPGGGAATVRLLAAL